MAETVETTIFSNKGDQRTLKPLNSKITAWASAISVPWYSNCEWKPADTSGFHSVIQRIHQSQHLIRAADLAYTPSCCHSHHAQPQSDAKAESQMRSSPDNRMPEHAEADKLVKAAFALGNGMKWS